MKKHLLLLVISYVVFLYSCSKTTEKQTQKNIVAQQTPFDSIICGLQDFNYLYQCNQIDSTFQVELWNDPFKDLILITCSIKDNEIDSLRYARFRFNSKRRNTLDQPKFIVNPYTNDTLFISWQAPKAMRVTKNRTELGQFLLNVVWKSQGQNDPPCELDCESWTLKGRIGDKQIKLIRNTFSDTLFYHNLQFMLDECKIVDYKFQQNAAL